MTRASMSHQFWSNAAEIIDFRISTGSLAQHLGYLLDCAARGRGLWVVTLNLEMVATALRDPGYGQLLRDADILVADGMPLVWLSRLSPRASRVPERTSGADLASLLLRSDASRPIGLVGGLDPARIARTLALPEGRVGFVEAGHVDASIECVARLRRRIAESGCGIVLVGLGVPKQDQVCRALRDTLPGVVCVGVGGALDMLAGLKPRAPLWMQRTGLEWLYRLLHEPRRLWRRYGLLYPRTLPTIGVWAFHRLRATARGIDGNRWRGGRRRSKGL